MNLIKKFFRDRCLRKKASGTATGITPLSELKSAVVLLDLSEGGCADFEEFFFRHGISCRVVGIDFGKTPSDGAALTAKDLNWFGKPSEKMSGLVCGTDLLICLLPESFAAEYLTAVSDARFKVGRRRTAGRFFDVVVADSPEKVMSGEECFSAVKDILIKIV